MCGAAGRMGSEACRAVDNDADTELVAAVESSGAVASFVAAATQVVVDFTVADAARINLMTVADAGIHAVVGTSGLDADDVAALRKAFVSSHCLIVPNFAIGAVLMTRFAAMAAPFFDTAEVVEYHHNKKIDAPSGTALQTAEAMAAASGEWGADPTDDMRLPGARGGRGAGGIPVHSVRLKGIVACQEVLLGSVGETLAIRHNTIDRSSFMPGVLLAVKRVIDMRPGLTVGLDGALGFSDSDR